MRERGARPKRVAHSGDPPPLGPGPATQCSVVVSVAGTDADLVAAPADSAA